MRWAVGAACAVACAAQQDLQVRDFLKRVDTDKNGHLDQKVASIRLWPRNSHQSVTHVRS